MEENMGPESISWALQPSHILCSALTEQSKIRLKLRLSVSNSPLEGCQGCSDTSEPSSNFQPKFIDGQFKE